jgi:hypothetical protein
LQLKISASVSDTKSGEYFCGQRQTSLFGLGAVKDCFQSSKLLCIDVGRLNADVRSGLVAIDAYRSGSELPRQSLGFGAVVNGRMALLSGRNHGAINEMKLVTICGTLNVITDVVSIGKTECLTLLLMKLNTLNDGNRTIALTELIGVHISLDSTTKFLSGIHGCILGIVSIERSGLCARRTLGNSGQTVPSSTLGVSTLGGHGVYDALFYASKIFSFANLVPNKFRHVIVLLLIV